MELLILKILCPKAKLKRSSTDVQRCSQPLSSNPDWSYLHTNQHGNQCHQMRALFWSSNSSVVFVWMLVYINTDMISSSPFHSFYRFQTNYITTRWQVEQTLPIIIKLKYSAAFGHEIIVISTLGSHRSLKTNFQVRDPFLSWGGLMDNGLRLNLTSLR